MNKILNEFTHLCQHYFGQISTEIRESLKFNHGITFDTASFGERVLFVLYETKGIPSNGGCAHDSLIKAEAKACNFSQTYTCPDCNAKNNYYQTNCWKCNGTRKRLSNDTRWHIDTKAHQEYLDEIPFYLMSAIFPLNSETLNPKFKIEVFRFETKDEFFCKMLNHQFNHGSHSKNFIPYSRDFYMSSPTLILRSLIDCHENNVDVQIEFYGEEKFTQMPIKLFTKSEREQLNLKYPKIIEKEMIDISIPIEVIGVKHSTHGKKRGKLNRNKTI